jgi:hypothetical protein
MALLQIPRVGSTATAPCGRICMQLLPTTGKSSSWPAPKRLEHGRVLPCYVGELTYSRGARVQLLLVILAPPRS